MTYIKWKDEVESYLVNLPDAEKQKIFSYFSEMYADKREAGKSEAQIIEEFGAPYDVAKRILADSRENASSAEGGAGANNSGASGGNNYNYNYYNYNYGGAPAAGNPPPLSGERIEKAEPAQSAAPEQPTAQASPQPKSSEKKAKSAGHVVLAVFLTLCLIPLSIFLIGAPIAGIVQGATVFAAALGALVADKASVGLVIANVGYGLINIGGGFLLLAPFSVLSKFLWKKLKAFM